jgi:hypothetical protein
VTLQTPSHNPFAPKCRKRLSSEISVPGEHCRVCEKDALLFVDKPPLPVCIYCWRPLVKFMPSGSYKGPASEWTHFQKLDGNNVMMTVLCRSKQHGPRIPRMIPGRLIIEEEEAALIAALAED